MSEKPITLTGGLLAGLALLSAAGPFSIDMYLPGLPQLGRDLATTNAQLTLSGFMIGMATGQLIIGVLSDTFGRKRFIVGGAALALITSPVVRHRPKHWHPHRRPLSPGARIRRLRGPRPLNYPRHHQRRRCRESV